MLSVRMEGVADRTRTDAAGITTPGAAVTPQPPCQTRSGRGSFRNRLALGQHDQIDLAHGLAVGFGVFRPRAKNGSDRIRTGTLSPDKRALCSLSYAPKVARLGFEPRISSS